MSTQEPANSDKMANAIAYAIAYAIARHKATGQPYIVSNEGHAVMDCRGNRKMFRDMECEVAYSTRLGTF